MIETVPDPDLVEEAISLLRETKMTVDRLSEIVRMASSEPPAMTLRQTAVNMEQKNLLEVPASHGIPELGTIFCSQRGDTIMSVASSAIERALHDCNRESIFGTPDFDRLVSDAAVAITLAPWNERLLATSANRVSPRDRISTPTGRCISFTPSHLDNVSRMQRGLPPRRCCSKSGGRHPQLWIPTWNLDILEDELLLTCEGMSWDDGSSMQVPPPWIMALGMEDQDA